MLGRGRVLFSEYDLHTCKLGSLQMCPYLERCPHLRSVLYEGFTVHIHTQFYMYILQPSHSVGTMAASGVAMTLGSSGLGHSPLEMSLEQITGESSAFIRKVSCGDMFYACLTGQKFTDVLYLFDGLETCCCRDALCQFDRLETCHLVLLCLFD